MFHVVLYLVCYLILVGVFFAVRWLFLTAPEGPPTAEEIAVRRRRRLRFAGVIAVLPVVPYLVVEGQTALFGAAMMPAVRQGLAEQGDAQQVLMVKVLYYSSKQTSVYVVTPAIGLDGEPGALGQVMSLRRTSAGWAFVDGEAVFADGGSADGNVFPPYAAKGEWHVPVAKR